jgi:hypothetical protein
MYGLGESRLCTAKGRAGSVWLSKEEVLLYMANGRRGSVELRGDEVMYG